MKQSSFPIAEAQVLSPVEPHMTNMKSSLSQVRSESLQSSARNAYTMLQVACTNMLHWVEGKFKRKCGATKRPETRVKNQGQQYITFYSNTG